MTMYADDTSLCHQSRDLTQLNEAINSDLSKLETWLFFSIHIKNYTTCYIYVLLYFLITRQQYNTTGTGPQGARDDDYPVAINIKAHR